jgi:hypothetical protein
VTTNGGDTTNTIISRLDFYEEINQVWTRCNTNEEIILQGEGLAAQDELFVGLQLYDRETDDIYNMRIAAFDGYISNVRFEDQPNCSTIMAFPLWNLGTEYRLAVNKQRITCIAKVDTYYHSIYLGKFFPYNSPGQFPYNICVGGSGLASNLEDYSWSSWAIPYKGSSGSRLAIRDVAGNWVAPACWPWAQGSTYRDIDSEHAVMPIIMGVDGTGLFGQFDGVFFCSGFNNAVENTIQIGADDYFVCHDVYRTGNNDHFCMLEE